MIGWVVLTLSWRQANFCLSMSQPWPWVKIIKRSSSTYPRPILSLSQISKILAQTVLTWETKVIVVAAAADADADTETNCKHKVTPDWGDLIMSIIICIHGHALSVIDADIWALILSTILPSLKARTELISLTMSGYVLRITEEIKSWKMDIFYHLNHRSLIGICTNSVEPLIELYRWIL